MFENLTDRLSKTLKGLRGQGRLSEDNIKESLRDVRQALLEADVALPVVRDFIEAVREKALGKDVIGSLSPGQALVKVVNDELVAVMGDSHDGIDLNVKPPVTILMAGLQGAGKTTTVAKLARRLIEVDKKSVMVASADIYRPAAIEQLQTLANEVNAVFHPSDSTQKPVEIARSALAAARKYNADVLILDTAGRLHIDQQMMGEIKAIHDAVLPTETLFVVDSMTGQDAANTAKAFGVAQHISMQLIAYQLRLSCYVWPGLKVVVPATFVILPLK